MFPKKSALLVALGAGLGVAGAAAFDVYEALAAYGTCHQTYPNVEGRVLIENDKFVVQRFIFPPGQWEGVHAHPPHQIYIHLKGGSWTVRNGEDYQNFRSPNGSVGFYGPVSLEDDHESVNSGTEPIDLIWVTLKEGCGG